MISYDISLSQDEKRGTGVFAKIGNVILERNNDDTSGIAFIAATDTVEFIYDGRFGFVVNHNRKIVSQVNPENLKSGPVSNLVISYLLAGFRSKTAYLKEEKISEKGNYWLINFITGKYNDLSKIWVNKTTMLPEMIFKKDISGQTSKAKLANFKINDPIIPKPTVHISKYIESYTLLPIGDIGIKSGKDSRDSLVGSPAPDFILTDFSGNKVSLSNFEGKYVLLSFWEVWCGPCRMSMPHLEELFKLYHQKGLEIIGLTKDNQEFARKLLSDKKVTYLNLKADDKVIMDYKVLEIPQYYLINKQGEIVYASKNGFEQAIEDIIRKELK